jgi:N-acetylglucosaminylphosphatidylinositol deacetylase
MYQTRRHGWDKSTAQTVLQEGALVVFVIAHPDDESMFFVPTIRALQNRHTIWLLCLTTGDYDGLGKIRSKELYSTCRDVLKLDKVIQVDDPTFIPDHPNQHWSIEYVASCISKTLRSALDQYEKNFQYIEMITFDHWGISGHVNHRDTFSAVQQLYLDQRTRAPASSQQQQHQQHMILQTIQAWSIETIRNPIVKYVPVYCWLLLLLHWLAPSFVPSTFTTIEQGGCPVYRLLDPLLNWRAMASHRSQFVWYRRLFVVFSCYTYVNRSHAMEACANSKTAKLPVAGIR